MIRTDRLSAGLRLCVLLPAPNPASPCAHAPAARHPPPDQPPDNGGVPLLPPGRHGNRIYLAVRLHGTGGTDGHDFVRRRVFALHDSVRPRPRQPPPACQGHGAIEPLGAAPRCAPRATERELRLHHAVLGLAVPYRCQLNSALAAHAKSPAATLLTRSGSVHFVGDRQAPGTVHCRGQYHGNRIESATNPFVPKELPIDSAESATHLSEQDLDLIGACVFQTKAATDSRGSLPPIPRESCH